MYHHNADAHILEQRQITGNFSAEAFVQQAYTNGETASTVCLGPILGAALLTILSDGLTEGLHALGWEFPGVKQVFYGVVLLFVVMFLPHGIWPALAKKLKVER